MPHLHVFFIDLYKKYCWEKKYVVFRNDRGNNKNTYAYFITLKKRQWSEKDGKSHNHSINMR